MVPGGCCLWCPGLSGASPRLTGPIPPGPPNWVAAQGVLPAENAVTCYLVSFSGGSKKTFRSRPHLMNDRPLNVGAPWQTVFMEGIGSLALKGAASHSDVLHAAVFPEAGPSCAGFPFIAFPEDEFADRALHSTGSRTTVFPLTTTSTQRIRHLFRRPPFPKPCLPTSCSRTPPAPTPLPPALVHLG